VLVLAVLVLAVLVLAVLVLVLAVLVSVLAPHPDQTTLGVLYRRATYVAAQQLV
jgi:hypothetical protein